MYWVRFFICFKDGGFDVEEQFTDDSPLPLVVDFCERTVKEIKSLKKEVKEVYYRIYEEKDDI